MIRHAVKPTHVAKFTVGLRGVSTRHRMAVAPVLSPAASVAAPASLPDRPRTFIQTLPTSTLISYAMLNFVTSSKVLLNTAIKLMPYMPKFVIKSIVGPIYVGGETHAEVLATCRRLLDRGIGNAMLSYVVEDADGTAPASAFASCRKEICGSIDQVLVKHNEFASDLFANGTIQTAPASGYVALKPTGIMKDSANILANYNNPEYAAKWAEYVETCKDICQYAVDHGKGKAVIVFDAEKDWLQAGVYAIQREMMKEFNRDGKMVVCGTLQMYLQKSMDILREEISLAEQGGYQIAMKLVRGAYIHSEPNRWEVIHKTKEESDISFNQGADLMLDHITAQWKSGTPGPVGRVVIASHNIESCDRVDRRMAIEAPLSFDFAADESVVFGQLMGMNEDQSQDLAARGRKVVKYVPWGPVKETRDYLTRRLEENGDAARGGWDQFTASITELSRRALRLGN